TSHPPDAGSVYYAPARRRQRARMFGSRPRPRDRHQPNALTSSTTQELAMTILDKVRLDPKPEFESNSFRTGPASGSFTAPEGGLCTITATKAADGIYNLVATAGGGKDYYYPWLRCGVGWVKVPTNVPDGTIVMTGGVNGCTMVVSESNGYYYFY